MVIDIEYMSPIFVGQSPPNSNLFGSSCSGGDQRMVLDVDVSDIAAGSARRPRPSSEMRILSYTKVSVIV